MDKSVRLLKWSDGVLKFPCGVTVSISEEKIKKLFILFKLEKQINEMISTGKEVAIPKGPAFQIKNHLT